MYICKEIIDYIYICIYHENKQNIYIYICTSECKSPASFSSSSSSSVPEM